MKMKYYDFDDIITFGRHNGLKISEIFQKDISYIVWVYQKCDDVSFSDRVFIKLIQKYNVVPVSDKRLDLLMNNNSDADRIENELIELLNIHIKKKL